jgi:uncharacterized membrane protein
MLSKHRIETLVDGIFAIAMTIPVLGLTVDEIPTGVTAANLGSTLSIFWSQIYHYAIAFLVLAAFYIGLHQIFHHINHVDRRFIWITMLGLFVICLVPFTSGLAGDFPSSFVAIEVFSLNLLLIGLYAYLSSHYAERHGLISPDTPKALLEIGRKKSLAPVVISLMVMGAAFFIPEWATTLFILIFLVNFIIQRTSEEQSKC